MTTKKSARIVDTGAKGGALKASSNGLTPPVVIGRNNVPAEMWRGVKKGEAGSAFAPVDFVPPELVTEKNLTEYAERTAPVVWRNQFIRGASPFIWYWIAPRPKDRVTKAKKDAEQKKRPINFKNKLDDKTRKQHTKKLASNIDTTANFMVKDLLPITLALHSGIQKANELMAQMLDLDTKVELPVGYLQAKMQMGVNLRVIRFISDQLSLTAEERKLMALEYTRPWSQS